MKKCPIHPAYKAKKKPRCKWDVRCSCWSSFYKLNPNAMINNPLTGQKNWMTMREWRNKAKESAQRLIKAFNDPTGMTPI